MSSCLCQGAVAGFGLAFVFLDEASSARRVCCWNIIGSCSRPLAARFPSLASLMPSPKVCARICSIRKTTLRSPQAPLADLCNQGVLSQCWPCRRPVRRAKSPRHARLPLSLLRQPQHDETTCSNAPMLPILADEHIRMHLSHLRASPMCIDHRRRRRRQGKVARARGIAGGNC